MLNLASLVSGSIWRHEENDYQRFNIELGSNLITVRCVILNLTIICQKCKINMIRVDLRYEQF